MALAELLAALEQHNQQRLAALAQEQQQAKARLTAQHLANKSQLAAKLQEQLEQRQENLRRQQATQLANIKTRELLLCQQQLLVELQELLIAELKASPASFWAKLLQSAITTQNLAGHGFQVSCAAGLEKELSKVLHVRKLSWPLQVNAKVTSGFSLKGERFDIVVNAPNLAQELLSKHFAYISKQLFD